MRDVHVAVCGGAKHVEAPGGVVCPSRHLSRRPSRRPDRLFRVVVRVVCLGRLSAVRVVCLGGRPSRLSSVIRVVYPSRPSRL